MCSYSLNRKHRVEVDLGYSYPENICDVYVIDHDPHRYDKSIPVAEFIKNEDMGKILSIIQKQPVPLNEDPELNHPEDPNVTKIRDLSDIVIESVDILETVPEKVEELLVEKDE